MNPRFEQVLKRIYVDKDYELLRSRAKTPLPFLDEYLKGLSKYGKAYGEDENRSNIEIDVDIPPKALDKFSYWTQITISKIVGAYQIYHYCKVRTKSAPYVNGFGESPYHRHQSSIEKYTEQVLKPYGYGRLTRYEAMEKVDIPLARPKRGEKDIFIFMPERIEEFVFGDPLELIEYEEEEV